MVQVDKTRAIVVHAWQNFRQPQFIGILKLYLQREKCTDYGNSQITAVIKRRLLDVLRGGNN
jgi:hypothetical protein